MTLTQTEASAAGMVSRVDAVLRQYAAQGEAERRLAPQAMQAIIDAGLMRTWIPRAYGGLEMDPLSAVRMFEDISRIDGAAGWVVSQCSIFAYLGLLYPREANQEMYADPHVVLAGAWNPPGRAERVEGGYRVTGQWPFSSGCNYAGWLNGLAWVTEGGKEVLGPDGNPQTITVYVAAKEATILDTWHTLGMRGTGSHDVKVDNVFVPLRRTWQIQPLTATDPAFSGPLYRHGVWINAPTQSCVALGIARGALDELISLAQTKTPSYQQTNIADKPLVQDRIARARALIEAGESYIERTLERAWDFVTAGPKIDMTHGIELALAGCFAHEAACQAVDLIHTCAGSTAIRDEYRFQQYFRDVHTLSQHAFTGAARYESLGKLMLGKETDWGFYYL